MRVSSRTLALAVDGASLALILACGDGSPTSNVPLVAPTGLAATATSANTVHLSFTAVPGAKGYVIRRATETGEFAEVGRPSGASFDDGGLEPVTAYRYEVAAFRGSETGPLSDRVSVTTRGAAERQVSLSGTITANRTLTADTVYVLSGYVQVKDGATLTIHPGTKIVGDTLAPGSSLLIVRGAKIVAEGTAAHPIVFSSQRESGKRAPGDWGGLSIVGNATTNFPAGVHTEGGNGGTTPYTGGTNDNDNSGVLRYVRIEFAGYAVVPDLEMNSLSLYAVGRETTIDHVQVLMGLDDSFKWFGGTVDGKYLVSYEASDDHFDVSQGYRGRNQFLIALQTHVLGGYPGSGSPAYDNEAFEADGCEAEVGACGGDFTRAPYSVPVFANFTVVGFGTAVTGNENRGLMIRRGSGGVWVNGIVARFRDGALTIRDAFTDELRTRDSLALSHLLFAENGSNFDPDGQYYGQRSKFATSAIEESSASAASLFASLPGQPTTATLDWTPASGSPVASGGLTSFSGRLAARAGSFIVPTSYRGAVDPAGPKWWQGWTIYSPY
jgi:hypothetical protein